ncbi:hypothetical protein R6Q59_024084 [Mikania micrantha]
MCHDWLSFRWPFLGETLALLRANWDGVPERFVRERIDKYGSPLVFKTSLLGDRMAVLCGPAGNKFLFGNENKLVAVWWPSPVRKLFAAAIRTKLATIIKARKVEPEERKASSSQDLLSHLVTSSDENGRFLTKNEIANNIFLLLFTGHDTSTVSITLLMKTLGEHPDVYDKVLKEQLEISNAKKEGELLKWEDIQKMRYSWNVVLEVMRLNPPVDGAYREALMDIEYAGYTIPKGWKIHWSAASTHNKDESNFEDVTCFDPSRFEGA